MNRSDRIRMILRKAAEIALFGYRPAHDPNSQKYQRREARLAAYTLPDPLITLDGVRVQDAKTWFERRRPEIIELFQTNVYGHSPKLVLAIDTSDNMVDEHALNGHATRKEVSIGLTGYPDLPSIKLLFYIPNNLRKQGRKIPIFLGLNFLGNHTINKDPAISITKDRIADKSISEKRPLPMPRGRDSASWPVEFILRRGYGVATAYYGDIVQDHRYRFYLDIKKHFGGGDATNRATDSWGAIGVWAWSLSRAMDYIEQEEELDVHRVAVMGHSRLGKAALWAGAQDERFAMVISNESGRGGAALFRRNFGETVARINASFPHWFCDRFKSFSDREEALPIDQHELIALIAPRPVYVASAQSDLHADPMGEFLSLKYANPVYRLLGTSGLPIDELPAANTPVMGTMGYHIRKGYHGITTYDWVRFLAFADKHLLHNDSSPFIVNPISDKA